MAIDRVRFRRKIHQSELILAPILNYKHRLSVLCDADSDIIKCITYMAMRMNDMESDSEGVTESVSK